MWDYIFVFAGGVYFGTYYNCKPALDGCWSFVKNKLPSKRDIDAQEQNNVENERNNGMRLWYWLR